MAATADKTKPYIPLASLANDGYSKEDEATATCFCGAVQLAFPIEGPGLVNSFVCNCTDCRKLTASMFASNFTILDTYLKHLRGQDKMTSWSNNVTIQRESTTGGHATMTNYFCSTCGTLMYRVGSAFPGMSILRIGTVDDFNLAETKLKPTVEQFIEDRVAWWHGMEGVKQVKGSAYGKAPEPKLVF